MNDTPLRILLAVHHFPPGFTGGAEGQALRQSLALQARGHQVQVVSIERIDDRLPPGLHFQDEIYQGIAVRRLSFNLSLAPDVFRYTYDNPWVGDHLRGMMTASRPDLFYLICGYWMSAAGLNVAHELGIPAVFSPMDLWAVCPRVSMMRSDGTLSTFPISAARCAQCLGEEKRSWRWLGGRLPGLMSAYWRRQAGAIARIQQRQQFMLRTLNRAGAIITNSHFLRDTLAGQGVDPQRLVFLRQGRDFPGLDPERLAKPPADCLRLGYMGQVAELKGIHVLLEAVRLLPERAVQVEIYGDETRFPAYTARLKHIAAGDTRIRFMGTFSTSEARVDAFRSLDALVVPSVWYENSPNVILEAFAHRTPVVASALGGMAELVADEHGGLLFAHGQPAELARQLERLIDEPGLLARLAAGIPAVKSEAQEIDELEAHFYRLAGSNPP